MASSSARPPQEVSANVTIETTASPSASSSSRARLALVGQQRLGGWTAGQVVPHDALLGRWRLTLDLFGRVFVDDVGLESGSIISELGGFPVKEAKFRREMERLRNSRTQDLTISKIERERAQLIVQVRKPRDANRSDADIFLSVQAFKEFNTHYNSNHRRASPSQPPLVVNRVKVGQGISAKMRLQMPELMLIFFR